MIMHDNPLVSPAGRSSVNKGSGSTSKHVSRGNSLSRSKLVGNSRTVSAPKRTAPSAVSSANPDSKRRRTAREPTVDVIELSDDDDNEENIEKIAGVNKKDKNVRKPSHLKPISTNQFTKPSANRSTPRRPVTSAQAGTPNSRHLPRAAKSSTARQTRVRWSNCTW